MKVLVVGGAGYIGSHCVRQLIEAGHEPVVLDNLVIGHRAAVPSSVPFYQVDLGEVAAVSEVLQKEAIELVMHFAAFALVGESVQDPMKYYENNVVATLRLLQAMRNCGVNKFVFSSTCAVYGVPEKLPLTESTPTRPINPYGQTKLTIEKALAEFAPAYGLSYVAFRYFNAAGAAEDASIGEAHPVETHLIPLAIFAAQGQREALTIMGDDYPTPDGTCLRDYVHVDDLARAHIAAFEKLEEPGTQLVYNLGTGKPTSVREIVEAIEAETGLTVPVTMGPRRAGDPPALYADSRKAQTELNWKPQHQDIRSIVASAWNWHRTHPHLFES